jgi:hypothetical protein
MPCIKWTVDVSTGPAPVWSGEKSAKTALDGLVSVLNNLLAEGVQMVLP